MLQNQYFLAMRRPLNTKRIDILTYGFLLSALTMIICSILGQIGNIEIPHITDRDLIFWLIEVHEQ